jgi:hypothetical protein
MHRENATPGGYLAGWRQDNRRLGNRREDDVGQGDVG